MKYFLWIVFAVWLLVTWQIFFVDTGNQVPQAQVVNGENPKTEIVFWHAMGGPLGICMENLINDYNNQSKDYYVKAINMGGYDTLQKKLLASLIANEAPDLAQNYETLTKKFIKHQKIVCFDDLLAQEPDGGKSIRDDVLPVLIRNSTFGGKLYSFPFNKSVQVLYYNKTMFKEVGLDPERPPQTFKELREYSQKIVDYYKNDGKNHPVPIYGYGCAKSNNWSFLNRIKANKGFIVRRENPDGTVSNDENGVLKCGFNKPAAIEAITFLQGMLKDGLAKEGQAFDHQNDFTAGYCGIIESSVTSKIFMKITDFELGMAPVPGSYNDDGSVYKSTILSGTNISIFKNGNDKKIAGAWDFVKWFTNTENGVKWSIGTTYMPVRKSSIESDSMKAALEKDPNLNAVYDSIDNLTFEPRITAWFEIRDMIADYLERSSLEKKEPKFYCEEMQRDINAILKHVSDTDTNKELE